MNFSLIAAADEKMGMGKNGTLPWGFKLKSDLAFFHTTTCGNGKNAVIMGRTTWESIPENRRPLAERINIILTHNTVYEMPQGVFKSASLNEALKIAQEKKAENVFVIGGAKVFEEAIHHPNCATIFFTEVSGDFRCDTFFPNIDQKIFKKMSESPMHEENGIQFRFTEYRKIQG